MEGRARAASHRCSTALQLNCAPATDKVHEKYDNGDDEQNVNQPACNVKDAPPKQPRYDQDNCEPYEHEALQQ
jgi:hypothetical protein